MLRGMKICPGSDSFVTKVLTLTTDRWYVTRFAEFLSEERKARLGIITSHLDKKQPWSEPESLPTQLQSPPLIEQGKTLPSPEEGPPRLSHDSNTHELQKYTYDKYYQYVDELYTSSSQECKHSYVTFPFFPSLSIFDNPFESACNPRKLPFNPSPHVSYSEPMYPWQKSSPHSMPSNRLQYGEYSYYYEDYNHSNWESYPLPTRPHTQPSSSTQLHDYFNIFT